MKPHASILVGVDFSPTSAIALRQALRIATASGASVRVLHVIETDVALGLEAAIPYYPRPIRDALVDDARKAWNEYAQAIPGAAGLPFEAAIDPLTDGLTRRAKASGADLIVLGAFGTRKPDVGFGTAATGCVRRAHCDVLLVRDTQATPFRLVVAAVDMSENSRLALQRAVDFAARDGAELVVLHVYSAPWHDLHYRAPTMLVEPKLQEQYLRGLDARLREFANPVVKDLPESRVRYVLEDASTHRYGIPDWCERAQADLIVLGTRGRTNLRDVLLGSTAEKVLKHARASVLAVRSV